MARWLFEINLAAVFVNSRRTRLKILQHSGKVIESRIQWGWLSWEKSKRWKRPYEEKMSPGSCLSMRKIGMKP